MSEFVVVTLTKYGKLLLSDSYFVSTLLVSNFDIFGSNCSKKKTLKLYKSKTLPFFIVFLYNFAANTTIKDPNDQKRKRRVKRPKAL